MDGDDYVVWFDCAKINSNDDSCLTLQSPRYKPRIYHYMPTKLKWILSYLSKNKVTKIRIEMENVRKKCGQSTLEIETMGKSGYLNMVSLCDLDW